MKLMGVNDGGKPQEHKYDCLRYSGQHFHEVLDCCCRFLGHVSLCVVSHDDATKGQSETDVIKNGICDWMLYTLICFS